MNVPVTVEYNGNFYVHIKALENFLMAAGNPNMNDDQLRVLIEVSQILKNIQNQTETDYLEGLYESTAGQ